MVIVFTTTTESINLSFVKNDLMLLLFVITYFFNALIILSSCTRMSLDSI